MMADLFDAPLVPGLATRPEIISAEEEASLIAKIDAEGLSPFRFHQWTGKRLTRSFGWSYDFESGRFAPTDPLPGWLEPVKARAAAFAGLAPDQLVQALLIRYDPARASAAIRTGRCSSMSSASHSVRPGRYACGSGLPAGSRAQKPNLRPVDLSSGR